MSQRGSAVSTPPSRKITLGRVLGILFLGVALTVTVGGTRAQAETRAAAEDEAFDTEYPLSDTPTPVEIRRKRFPAHQITVDEAVDQMELVGHDFFLFINEENNKPSVVYRRHAFDYGIISLSEDAEG